jgi:hypothetical protein
MKQPTLFLLEMRIRLIEFPYLAIGAPTEIAVPAIPQLRKCDLLESTYRVEARGEFMASASL